MRHIWILATSGLILALITGCGGGWSEKEREAISAAENWLGMVDRGNYQESWMESAEYLRNAIDSGQWEQAMNAVRKPLGGVVSREVESAGFLTSIPGAPDGEYVVIQFETVFENKKNAIETVTPLKDKDGRWRVSGYFIK